MTKCREAIETHSCNFVHADHDCRDVSDQHPSRYPSTHLLLASPECFAAGTLILTERGFRPIEEIAIGESVLTHRGRWRPVVRVQSRPASVVTVRGQGHTAGLVVTPNHRFWSRERGWRWDNSERQYRRRWGAPDWYPIGDTAEVDLYWGPPTVVDEAPWCDPPGLGDDPLAAWWLVGRWLGDGSVNRSSEVVISCGYQDEGILVPRLHATGQRWSAYRKRTAINFTRSDRMLRSWLVDNFGRGASNKGIPGWAFGMPASRREHLLAGYVSADGCVKDRQRVQVATVSKALAFGTRMLAEGLGNRASLYRREQHANRIEGRLVNVQPLWYVTWEHKPSSRHAFVEGGMAWSAVKSIEEGTDAQVPVYNLEVAEDHSYVAEGVAVRNCTNYS